MVPVVPMESGWPPPETGAPVQPVGNSVPRAGCIQAAFVRYQPRLACTGKPRMAIASLRRGAIRKEMLPHCVQERERGHPSEPGCVNPVRARTPNPVRRAPHRQPIPHVNRGDTPRLAASCPRAFLTATRTFLSRRLPRQVRLPSSICVHLWFLPLSVLCASAVSPLRRARARR